MEALPVNLPCSCNLTSPGTTSLAKGTLSQLAFCISLRIRLTDMGWSMLWIAAGAGSVQCPPSNEGRLWARFWVHPAWRIPGAPPARSLTESRDRAGLSGVCRTKQPPSSSPPQPPSQHWESLHPLQAVYPDLTSYIPEIHTYYSTVHKPVNLVCDEVIPAVFPLVLPSPHVDPG